MSYFGRLARVPLLTREGEIEIAKRVEIEAKAVAQLKLRARELASFLEGSAQR